MRHVNTRTIRQVAVPGMRTVTDPDTGRTYAVPAGGNGDDDPPGEPDPTDPPADDLPADPADDPADPDDLGDAGKRALQRERRDRKQAEKALKVAQDALTAAQDAQKTDHEKALDDAREEGRKAALATAAGTLAQAKAEGLVATKTSDPALAIAAMGDLSRFVGDDGTVDTDAMSDALDDVVEKHPALKPGETKPSGAGPSGGAKPPAGSDKPKGLKAGIGALVSGKS